MTPLGIWPKAAITVVVVLAATWDLRERRIPNWLTLAGIVAGFAINWKLALPGAALALAAQLPFLALRQTGAGDVKLMAAVGALAGPLNWLFVFAVSSILSGVGAFVQWRRGRSKLPRAPFVAAAAVLLWWVT